MINILAPFFIDKHAIQDEYALGHSIITEIQLISRISSLTWFNDNKCFIENTIAPKYILCSSLLQQFSKIVCTYYTCTVLIVFCDVFTNGAK